MENINFRLAKPSDAKQIAYVHLHIRDKYDQGFFAQVNYSFLKKYYRIVLNDPNEIIVCAENVNGKIVGFCSGSLDAKKQMKSLRDNKLLFVVPLFISALSKPSLIRYALDRFRFMKGKSKNKYVSTEGARLEYWGWLPAHNSEDAPVRMQEILFLFMKTLGVTKLYFEVDSINKKVMRFHKYNGAQSIGNFCLPDGRERTEFFYDMQTYEFKYINV